MHRVWARDCVWDCNWEHPSAGSAQVHDVECVAETTVLFVWSRSSCSSVCLDKPLNPFLSNAVCAFGISCCQFVTAEYMDLFELWIRCRPNFPWGLSFSNAHREVPRLSWVERLFTQFLLGWVCWEGQPAVLHHSHCIPASTNLPTG